MMFKTSTPVIESAHDVIVPSDPIPLSQLELDLPAPTTGWLIELDRRGIAVVLDDLGRKSISRDDARTLLDEQRENEVRRQEAAERNEQRAIEADMQWRSQLNRGVPWYAIPAGVTPAEAWAQAEKDARPRRVTPLQEALEGGGMVYRPLRDDGDEQ
jgi:hypothetical protein